MLIVRCSACSTLLNNRTSSTALCSCFACVCASFVFLLSHPVHNVHAERGQNWLRRLFKGRQTGNSEPAYCLKWLVFGVRRLLVISVQAPCTVATSTLYSHYKHLVLSLQSILYSRCTVFGVSVRSTFCNTANASCCCVDGKVGCANSFIQSNPFSCKAANEVLSVRIYCTEL